MPIRVLFAAILGGGLMFGGGFVDHTMLHWCERQMKGPTNETAFRDTMKAHFPAPGIYFTPWSDKKMDAMTEDEKKAQNELYKKGSALVIVAPTDKDMMTPDTLIKEGVTNVIACLLAAIVVAMTRPSIGFFGRWFVVLMFGGFAAFSLSASYHIWYQFPLEYVQDELMCQAFEAALAGVAIAAIVVPRERMGY